VLDDRADGARDLVAQVPRIDAERDDKLEFLCFALVP